MITFGTLTTENIPRIVEIESQSFQEPWSFEGFLGILSNPSFASLGIFLNRSLVGYVFYYLVMNELHIMNIAVDPIHRQKGHGEILLTKVHEVGKKHAIQFAYLEVRETNASAQRLYKKLGYQKQGRRIGYYPNQEDAYLMYKEL